eukprot:12426981-Karenia_brevis.AAC.1
MLVSLKRKDVIAEHNTEIRVCNDEDWYFRDRRNDIVTTTHPLPHKHPVEMDAESCQKKNMIQ